MKYDLDEFVTRHPGGKVAILLGKDIDATALFESYHIGKSRARALAVAHQYRVSEEISFVPQMSNFKQDLDAMLEEHFSKKSRHASWFHMLLCFILFLLTFYLWISWAKGDIFSTFMLPFVSWLFIVNTSHDASHFAFSKHASVNFLLMFTSLPLVYNPMTWLYQHVIAHHTFVNEAEHDVDLQHFAPVRLHKNSVHSVQPSIANILKLFLVGIHLNIGVPLFVAGILPQSIYKSLYQPAIWLPLGLKGRRIQMLSLLGPISTFAYVVTSCIMRGSFCKGVLFASIPLGIMSILFVAVTQISHIQNDAQELKDDDFFKAQVESSVDYSSTSYVVSFLTGGLNTQSIHHVFPGVASCHYTKLFPKFRQICKKHDVRLNERTSFGHALFTTCCYIVLLNKN